MIQQYKELHDAIMKAAQESLDTAQATDKGFSYTLLDNEVLILDGSKIDINFLAVMIRTGLAIKVFGEQHEGFVL